MFRIATLVLIISVFALWPPVRVVQKEHADSLVTSFKAGDVMRLSPFFNNTVELTLDRETQVFSKVQAEQVLAKFFKRNRIQSFDVIKQILVSRTSTYVVAQMLTDDGLYQVSYSLNRVNGKVYIKQLKIEK